MEILVTGGCGFIGSHLVDRLVADGHSVTVLDNLSTGRRDYLPSNVRLVEGDVADEESVSLLVRNVDLIFHLAAVSSVEACTQNWLNSHQTNLTGTITVLDAASSKKIPVIYASSAAVYGDNQTLPLSEDAETHPLSAYGLDKLSCEKYAKIAAEFHGVPSVGLRLFNVYGPRQNARSPYSDVVSKFMANAQAGLPLTFNGDGEQTRDFIYVGDVIELLLAASRHAVGATVYNGCTGRATSLKELVTTLTSVTGTTLTTAHAQIRPGDIRHSQGNPAHAAAHLGFHASTPLSVGLTALAGSHD